ncbi:MAG TPA: hypothetical protein VKX33_12185 [Cyclobacteriaceae bacterium]|nr:hypothetical protein [Cyclobacteriaceae bacterium]
MDLLQELTHDHSRASRDRIVSYVQDDADRFAELFDLFKNGERRIAQRAAWSVSYCAEKFPELIYPYCDELVDYLRMPAIHDSIKRNILRILQDLNIPVALEESLLELCFAILMDKKEAVAIRVFAMQVLANLAKKYPEIKNELNVLIEDELPYAKPAFVSRGRKILKG